MVDFPVTASGAQLSSCGARATQHSGFSCCRATALGRLVSAVVCVGSVVMVHWLSCPGMGSLLDQGLIEPMSPALQEIFSVRTIS